MNRTRSVLVTLVSSLAMACASTSASHGVSTAAVAPGAAVQFEAPLTFEAAGGRALPVPMVEATVAGAKTRLIVDTGASDHVLTVAFVTANKLPVKQGSESGRDHAGATLQEAIAHSDGLSNEHALLGMDVLKQCVLAIPQDRAAKVLARCTATEARSQ